MRPHSITWVTQSAQVRTPYHPSCPTCHRGGEVSHFWARTWPNGSCPPASPGVTGHLCSKVCTVFKPEQRLRGWTLPSEPTSISSSITLLLLPNSYQAVLYLKFYKGFILFHHSGLFLIPSWLFIWIYYLFFQAAYEG